MGLSRMVLPLSLALAGEVCALIYLVVVCLCVMAVGPEVAGVGPLCDWSELGLTEPGGQSNHPGY